MIAVPRAQRAAPPILRSEIAEVIAVPRAQRAAPPTACTGAALPKMNKLLLLAFAAAVTGTTLDYHQDAGWCDGLNTADDCQMDNSVACPSGENADVAADCWANCAAEYSNLVAVDIAVDDMNAGMCQCCCQTECTCLSDIESSSLAVQSGLALPGPCSPIPWLACTDEVRTCTMSETNYMSRGSNCNSGNWRRVPDAIAPSDFSFEVCSAACIAETYCIGIETHYDHAADCEGPTCASGDNIWDNCIMVFEDSFEDCPDGENTFYPKDCQCPPAPTPRPTCFYFFDQDRPPGGPLCASDDDDDDDGRIGRDEDWFGSDAAARGPLLVVFIGAVAAALAH